MIAEFEGHRADLEALCRQFGVRRLEVFGSAATGGFREGDSDLDFLVEFQKPAEPGIADRFFGLLEALQTLFGRQVDLVVDPAITNPYFRLSVDGTKALLYAA
jgi:predicted nucleotidyltransferase